MIRLRPAAGVVAAAALVAVSALQPRAAGGPIAAAAPPLLPRVWQAVTPAGAQPFVLKSPVVIAVPSRAPRLSEIAALLAGVIRARTGFTVRVEAAGTPRGAIVIDAISGADGDESYDLTVDGGVRILGASATGALWGVQTLRQLLPPAFEDPRGTRPSTWSIPAVSIHDAPRFSWRGSMVDAGRHFFSADAIKRYIDLLSRYKINVFHWHLTEDQGWRIAIAKHPELTRVGAWRTEADGARYGGFYTQQDIRDVVEFARLRGVMVVPEIEMPGHSLAALASNPDLGCTGEPLRVATTWGVFADVYCPGNERTFTFLQDVLDEVMALFPSPYLHIGGDEVPKDRWRACESCQALMRREGLANEEELQAWFVARIGRYLASHGRRLIGWNEILNGGPRLGEATIQSWQDSSWTRRAALAGHDVIASPSEWTYLSRSARDLTLERVYAFEPVPPGLDPPAARRVLGGEAPLWSEHIPSGTNLDLMAFPRILAFAEVMWSDGPRDFASLQARLDADQLPRLRAMGVAVGPADRDLLQLTIGYDPETRTARVRTDAAPGVVVRMTRNGRPPTMASPLVANDALLQGDGLHRLQAFFGREPLLAERTVTIERHRAAGATTRLATPPDQKYPGTGAWNLTDGLRGSLDHADGLWQGWLGPDVDAVVDLGSVQPVTSVSIAFLQNIRSWIVLPSRVEFSWSTDDASWSAPVIRGHDVPVMRDGAIVQPFRVTVPAGTRARYLHVVGRNAGPLPAGHPGAGTPSWLFADEIVAK